ncbi:ATP-dependent sacrificial sulfur transferase LarE [Desulfobacula sp.]|uniref:ATP-dependent sacrificial sulfur transferase LarE n=1 Tax=Desulfobacula sp. TaxID=2593537 RepID=UPI002601EC90|nr:ATP-dependent sacrificial sulfur transferase LarE [Desulfobacula sp.]
MRFTGIKSLGKGAGKKKLRNLEKRLTKLSSFAVAFSGGVDSTFLLAVAKRVNPKRLLAIIVSSQFVPEREIADAKRLAADLAVPHICLEVDILENEAVVRNTRQRCYHCKRQMFSLIKQTAEKRGLKSLLHGVNLDDLAEFRPGLRAAEELGFLSPLADEGFTKADIRQVSRQLGLETWDKPSQSCLATRIPHDVRINRDDLVRVDTAEVFLQDLGFDKVRVRYHGTSARIEVDPGRIDRILTPAIRQEISEKFQTLGFAHTSIDLDGYR